MPLLRRRTQSETGSDASSSEAAAANAEVCWICFEAEKRGEPLVAPCSCPRRVHRRCLARWQLQSAGRTEETRCRFCNNVLPDWRESITPPDVRPAVPVMSIHFHNTTYWLEVRPGPEGLSKFQSEVRRLLGLSDNQDFDITFECKVPGTGSKMELRGLSAFDAAVYCASITAAERAKGERDLRRGRGHCCGSSDGSTSGSDSAVPRAAWTRLWRLWGKDHEEVAVNEQNQRLDRKFGSRLLGSLCIRS